MAKLIEENIGLSTERRGLSYHWPVAGASGGLHGLRAPGGGSLLRGVLRRSPLHRSTPIRHASLYAMVMRDNNSVQLH